MSFSLFAKRFRRTWTIKLAKYLILFEPILKQTPEKLLHFEHFSSFRQSIKIDAID